MGFLIPSDSFFVSVNMLSMTDLPALYPACPSSCLIIILKSTKETRGRSHRPARCQRRASQPVYLYFNNDIQCKIKIKISRYTSRYRVQNNLFEGRPALSSEAGLQYSPFSFFFCWLYLGLFESFRVNIKGKKCFNWKVFILPRVAELFIHKEKQRGCHLLGANKHTHIYIIYIYIYIIYLFETIVSKAWSSSSVFF